MIMEYNNEKEELFDDDFDIEDKSKNNNNLSKLNNENLTLKKKKLIEISKNLSKLEYYEIFNIIKEDNCNFSENKNGIFINLSNVNDITIDKILSFINFIKHKKEDLLKHEESINNAKKNISNIIKNTENIIPIEKFDILEQSNYSEEEDDEDNNNNNYLIFSSDEDEDVENKILLKKKKIKYSGKKAKMIKSIKDGNENKNRSRSKKKEDEI